MKKKEKPISLSVVLDEFAKMKIWQMYSQEIKEQIEAYASAIKNGNIEADAIWLKITLIEAELGIRNLIVEIESARLRIKNFMQVLEHQEK